MNAGSPSLGGPAYWEELLDLAKRNLDRYCAIMVQERMEDSARVLFHQLRKGKWLDARADPKVPFMHSHAQNPRQRALDMLGSESYNRALELNRVDMQLYEYALQRLEKDVLALNRNQTAVVL